jgi:hypothetical protein
VPTALGSTKPNELFSRRCSLSRRLPGFVGKMSNSWAAHGVGRRRPRSARAVSDQRGLGSSVGSAGPRSRSGRPYKQDTSYASTLLGMFNDEFPRHPRQPQITL